MTCRSGVVLPARPFGPMVECRLARDGLGLNKLFLAIHESGRVVAANYLIDLVRHGVPFEAIYSVPAGRAVDLDPARGTVVLSRYGGCDTSADSAPAAMEDVARDIRAQLEIWFSRLAGAVQRTTDLCLPVRRHRQRRDRGAREEVLP